jgi:hypothetical protein
MEVQMRKYTVICEWTDSGTMDADEIVVYADDAVQAVGKARKRWRLEIGLTWPNCRLDRTFVLTQPA